MNLSRRPYWWFIVRKKKIVSYYSGNRINLCWVVLNKVEYTCDPLYMLKFPRLPNRNKWGKDRTHAWTTGEAKYQTCQIKLKFWNTNTSDWLNVVTQLYKQYTTKQMQFFLLQLCWALIKQTTKHCKLLNHQSIRHKPKAVCYREPQENYKHIIKQITLTHVPLSLITAQILQLQLTMPKYTYTYT